MTWITHLRTYTLTLRLTPLRSLPRSLLNDGGHSGRLECHVDTQVNPECPEGSNTGRDPAGRKSLTSISSMLPGP